MSGPEPARIYLYCVIPVSDRKELGKIGIGGKNDRVYVIEYKDIAAVVSDTSTENFEKNEDNILAHQRVVERVFESQLGIPMPFATMAQSAEEVQGLLEERYVEFKDKLTKLGSFGTNGAASESSPGGAKELIEEALSQSASSAVKIRQLNEEIIQLRSMRYERAMDAVADAMMEKISAQFSANLSSLGGAIERLLTQIEHLHNELSRNSQRPDERKVGVVMAPTLDHEIRILREEMERLNRRNLEEIVVHAT